ncbi:MAG: D-alanine--D-alanine ligase [Clostridiales bacterium]|nr:D-alanine--D-alanine ligase [Clostridiales bacterium]
MKIKLAVLFGGKSVEHEISIISAVQAMAALNREKYDVIPVYITKDNRFFTGECLFDIESYKQNLKNLESKCERVIFVSENDKTFIVKYPQKKFKNNVIDYIDVALPIVHGTNVEDGTMQGFLQMHNIPYGGCDVMSSAVGMDKYVMKTVLKDNGIPVLDCKVYTSYAYEQGAEGIINDIEDNFDYPVIIKPINLGSSVGIKKASNREELEDALELAFEFSLKVLCERAIVNLKEINCAVLGDGEEAEASECEEPITGDEILSYKDKYMDNGSKGMSGLKRRMPADITNEQRDCVRDMAVKAFKCLGCGGVARIDFMMDTKTEEIFVNEINTIPGSLSFYLWEPLGIKYDELLDRLVSLALKRERERAALHFSFETNVLSGVTLGGAKGAKGGKLGG